ncbi:hypothetical protein ACPWR0_08205 [Pandoraea pneumonica]|uniref:SpaN/EivJ family type III secretion system needle length determinant n=1 Tax=Pandoraea pneumonica TaxID=2508299 RepID=UPI003CEDBA17
MDSAVIGVATTLPMSVETTQSAESADAARASRDDSEAAKAFESALRRRDAQRKRDEVWQGGGPGWQMLVRPEAHLPVASASGAEDAATAAEIERHSTEERRDGDRAEVRVIPKENGADRHMVRPPHALVEAADAALLSPRHQTPTDAAASLPTALTAGSTHTPSTLPTPQDHRKSDRGAPEGVPAWGVTGHAPRDAAPTAALSQQAPRDRPAHTLPGGSEPAWTPPGSDGMRYSFGSWGKGHFVQVQAVQVDGHQRFVLGASDALVQRRLQAMWPATSTGGAARWQLSGAGVSIVTAVAPPDDATQEEREC